MKIKAFILVASFIVISFNSLGQNTPFGQSSSSCDSIKSYPGDFDKAFQKEYFSIKADTLLLFRHYYYKRSSHLSRHIHKAAVGFLCWKKNGSYCFKKITMENDETPIIQKLNKGEKRALTDFFADKIFNYKGEVYIKYHVDADPGATTDVFSKIGQSCYFFNYPWCQSTDPRVVWGDNLMSKVR